MPGQMPASAFVMDRLRRLRKRRGLTQDTFAEAVTAAGYPINRTGVADAEIGRREAVHIDFMVAASAVLNVPLASILPGSAACLDCGDSPPSGFTCNACGTTSP